MNRKPKGLVPLTEENLKYLDEEQRKIVETQHEVHWKGSRGFCFDMSGSQDYLVNVGEGNNITRFTVQEGVFDPFLSSAHYVARFLFYNQSLYKDKEVLDLGCGSGLLGMVMAMHGAKHVTLSGISKPEVVNSKKNCEAFKLDNTTIIQSDLFENLDTSYDTIVWNIPFFPGHQPPDTISASMMMEPKLFERFFYDAREHVKDNGSLIIPSFSLGGDLLNPKIVGPQCGYNYKPLWEHKSTKGIQKGTVYIDQLWPK